jgi:hypothetical protein
MTLEYKARDYRLLVLCQAEKKGSIAAQPARL